MIVQIKFGTLYVDELFIQIHYINSFTESAIIIMDMIRLNPDCVGFFNKMLREVGDVEDPAKVVITLRPEVYISPFLNTEKYELDETKYYYINRFEYDGEIKKPSCNLFGLGD